MRIDAPPQPAAKAAEQKPKVEVHPGPGLSFTYVARDANGEEAWRYPNRPKEEAPSEGGKPGALIDLVV